MNWYKTSSDNQLKLNILNEISSLQNPDYSGRYDIDWIKYNLDNFTIPVLQNMLNNVKRRKQDIPNIPIEPPDQTKQVSDNIEDYFKVEPADEQYTRYVWGNQNDIEQEIKNGYPLNQGHDLLPKGWNYIHVGDMEWIAILNRDYGRSGPVCELTISNLPDGFYLVSDDPDIMNKINAPDSGMIVSKQNHIPAECIKITNIYDSEEIEKEYPEISWDS